MGRIYDNRTTIGFERPEDPVGGLGDALGRIVEQLAVTLQHHTGVHIALRSTQNAQTGE